MKPPPPDRALARRLASALERSRGTLVPPAFQFLWQTVRYIVLYGGRDAAKSWSIARTLLVMAEGRPLRVLCCREIQGSIKESAYRLLADQVHLLDLVDAFSVGADRITGRNDSEFFFEGLRFNANKIRSYEGIDIVWVEEAQSVSERSWEELIPTIRKPASRFYISYNPMTDSDPVHARFIAQPRADVLARKVSWRDNPYHSAEMEAERVWLLKTDPDAHAHVWEGEFQTHSDAQVFKGKYSIEAFEPTQGWSGPYFGADWGFSSDPTALVKCWVHERSLCIEHEAYAVKCDLDKTPELFGRIDGSEREIIRADSARPETISYMKQHGFPRMEGVEKWKGSVEDGIAHLRSYERIVVHPRCTHTAQEMRLYSYKVDRLSGNVMADVVDKNNHCIDALRYACLPLIKRKGGSYFDLTPEQSANLSRVVRAIPTSQFPIAPRRGGGGLT
jgi:phage terminase large subunit